MHSSRSAVTRTSGAAADQASSDRKCSSRPSNGPITASRNLSLAIRSCGDALDILRAHGVDLRE